MRARRLAARRHFGDGLMQIGIEAAVGRVDGLDAVAFQRGQQLALGRFHAFDHAFGLRAEGRARIGGKRLDGALEIVGHRQNIAGEFGHGVLGGVLLLALGAAARVFRVRPARAACGPSASADFRFQRGKLVAIAAPLASGM